MAAMKTTSDVCELGMQFIFLHIEVSPEGNRTKLIALPVKYFGPGRPASIGGICEMDYAFSLFRLTGKDGKAVDTSKWWLSRLLSTLFQVLPNPVAHFFTAIRDGGVAALIWALKTKYGTHFKFIVRDKQVPVAALNAMLAAANAPPIEVAVWEEISRGVVRIPHHSDASRSVAADERIAGVENYAPVVSLAIDVFNVLEPRLDDDDDALERGLRLISKREM